jgi:hypothetical protein
MELLTKRPLLAADVACDDLLDLLRLGFGGGSCSDWSITPTIARKLLHVNLA